MTGEKLKQSRLTLYRFAISLGRDDGLILQPIPRLENPPDHAEAEREEASWQG
jgi:hypothetical protein